MPTGESKLWGVSIRSWNASAIIIVATLTVSFLAVKTGEVNYIMLLGSNALSFLFGKAAGAAVLTK